MALDPVTAALDLGGKLIDKFFSSPADRDAAKLQLLQMQQTGELAQLTAETDLAKAQIAVNQEEAKSSSLFVSGGRPFIMWICGVAFAYVSVIEPLCRFVAVVAYHYTGAFPIIDTTITMQVLLGLLGLGAMRSIDKKNGVAS